MLISFKQFLIFLGLPYKECLCHNFQFYSAVSLWWVKWWIMETVWLWQAAVEVRILLCVALGHRQLWRWGYCSVALHKQARDFLEFLELQNYSIAWTWSLMRVSLDSLQTDLKSDVGLWVAYRWCWIYLITLQMYGMFSLRRGRKKLP